jgi:Co/Zn/Cd efflux system component
MGSSSSKKSIVVQVTGDGMGKADKELSALIIVWSGFKILDPGYSILD